MSLIDLNIVFVSWGLVCVKDNNHSMSFVVEFEIPSQMKMSPESCFNQISMARWKHNEKQLMPVQLVCGENENEYDPGLLSDLMPVA